MDDDASRLVAFKAIIFIRQVGFIRTLAPFRAFPYWPLLQRETHCCFDVWRLMTREPVQGKRNTKSGESESHMRLRIKGEQE